MTDTPSFLDRVETTGRLPEDAARNLNIVGPAARASGIDRDVRRDHPYAAYGKLKFRVPVYKEGDVNARHARQDRRDIRVHEPHRAGAGQACPAAISSRAVDVPAGRIGMGLVESPRGEAVHWLLTGKRHALHGIRSATRRSITGWPWKWRCPATSCRIFR